MYREVDIKEAVMAALDGKTVFGLNPLCPQDIYNLTEQIENLVKDGDHFIVDEPDPVEVAPTQEVKEPETPEEPKKKKLKSQSSTSKKKIDGGKINALYDAGWSIPKIADEMGCSKQTVYNYCHHCRHEGRLIMTAKQYLSQLREADMKIDQDIAQLSDLESKVTSIGSFDYSKDRVQTSPDGDAQYVKLMDKIVDMEAQINTEIDSFVDLKKTIIGQIRGLDNRAHSDILFRKYVQYETLSHLAPEVHYAFSTVKHMHASALREFEEKYLM